MMYYENHDNNSGSRFSFVWDRCATSTAAATVAHNAEYAASAASNAIYATCDTGAFFSAAVYAAYQSIVYTAGGSIAAVRHASFGTWYAGCSIATV